MIRVEHLSKSFGDHKVVDDVSFLIENGDVLSLIGPEGSGKSTLLRCLNGLEKPDSGTVYVNDVDIFASGSDLTQIRKEIGMVFRTFNLFPHRCVIENVMNPQIDLLGRTKREARDKALELLNTVGMDHRAFDYPADLTDGEKQRVAIARAIAMEPKILLLDEPTSNLDAGAIGEVQAVIRRLAQEGCTMVIDTRELSFAREISTRVAYIEDGKIIEEGTPEKIFEKPSRGGTRRFVKQLGCAVFNIDANNKDFNRIGFELENFAYKYSLSSKVASALRSVLEELCMCILLPVLGDDARIYVLLEYSAKEEQAFFKCYYTGPVFSPLDSDDAISLAILKKRTSLMKHTVLEYNEDGFTNRLVLGVANQ